MNARQRARLERIERQLMTMPNATDYQRVDSVCRYLQAGDAATIPDGVTFDELREAARRIGGVGSAARFKGLAELRAALADNGDGEGGDVLEYIRTQRIEPVRLFFAFFDDGNEKKRAAERLLSRLALGVVCYFAYDEPSARA